RRRSRRPPRWRHRWRTCLWSRGCWSRSRRRCRPAGARARLRPIVTAMCGRYTNTAGPEELNDRFRVPIESSEGTHRYNVAPTEEVLAVVQKEGVRRAELMRWGLVPSWAGEIKGPLMINARLETVAEKPAYRRLLPRGERRALQLADGYYEWLKPERRGEPKQPFHFRVDGGAPFA